jgi:hypothetical protein
MPNGQLKAAIKRIKQERAMAAKKKETALVKSNTTTVDVIRAELTAIADAFGGGEIIPEKLAQGWVLVKQIEDQVERVVKTAKQQVETYIRTAGTKVTDAGTLRAVVGNIQLEARPTRTGRDPKKVEALIRAKNMDPAKWMDEERSYKVNDGKLADAVKAGKLTHAELEACRYELTYAIQKPKPVGEDE